MARRARICNHPHMERREFIKRGLVGLYGLRALRSLPGAPAAAAPVALPLATAGPLIRPSSALTASGGLCAPLTPYYEITDFTKADRPVRDALPSFSAPRGL